MRSVQQREGMRPTAEGAGTNTTTPYPLASQNIVIDLDDGVKANYPKLGLALKKIPAW